MGVILLEKFRSTVHQQLFGFLSLLVSRFGSCSRKKKIEKNSNFVPTAGKRTQKERGFSSPSIRILLFFLLVPQNPKCCSECCI